MSSTASSAKPAERAEHARIGFGPAEAEAAGNVQRHLVAAVREQRRALPAVALQHRDCAGELHDAVGLRRIDLDDVAVGAQAAEAHQVLDVRRREQVLAGRERRRIGGGDLGGERIVERIARLLEPREPEGRQRLGIGERLVAAEFAVGVDRQPAARRHDVEHGRDRLDVLGKRQAADLHLHHRVAGIEMAAHLVLHVARTSAPGAYQPPPT